MQITQTDLDNWFRYHAPKGSQADHYGILRDAGKVLAETIVRLTPEGDDQFAAVRRVRDAIMTANAAIACAPTTTA